MIKLKLKQGIRNLSYREEINLGRHPQKLRLKKHLMGCFYLMFTFMWSGFPAIAQMDFPKDTILHTVDKSDVYWDVLQKEIKNIEATTPESVIGNKVTRFGRIEGKAIQSLFPDWKFYIFEYSNYKVEGLPTFPIGIAFDLGYTFAVPMNMEEPMRIMHTGNYEAYGDLLKTNKISINSNDDAKLVWNAFCEIHRKGWKNQKIEMLSTNEWKLGIYTYNQVTSIIDGTSTIVRRTHFFQVKTDLVSKQILGWKSVVESLNDHQKQENYQTRSSID